MNDEAKTDESGIFLKDKTYDMVKYGVTIVLPSVGTLYFALAATWGFPAAEQVLGTIAALQTFLGVVLGISTKRYKDSDARFDGTLTTTDTPKKKIISVETNLHPDALAEKDQVLLKVTPASQ